MFNLNKYPVLDLGNRLGHSGYIDFITWDEVTEPVMTGFDYYHRAFIVIKFIIDKDTDKPIKIMQTFFERYTNSKDLWMGCGSATEYLIYTFGGMKQEQFDFINKILEGKELKIPDNINSPFVGRSISLLKEKID